MAAFSGSSWSGFSLPQSQGLLLVSEQQGAFRRLHLLSGRVDGPGPEGPSVSGWIKGKGKDVYGQMDCRCRCLRERPRSLTAHLTQMFGYGRGQGPLSRWSLPSLKAQTSAFPLRRQVCTLVGPEVLIPDTLPEMQPTSSNSSPE